METMDMMCNKCNSPNFICKCDLGNVVENNSWENFDKVIENNCTGKSDLVNKVKYTSLNISTTC